MEEFGDKTASQMRRINQLEEFISLYFRKQERMGELKELSAKMGDVRVLVDDCAQLVDTFYEVAMKEYEELKRKLQAQQLTMLNIIKELRKRQPQRGIENCTPVNARSNCGASTSLSKKQLIGTPRMYLSEYKQSPFVLRIRPVALHFLDFERNITHEMFESIPKYIRGRETIDELTAFLEQVIVPCFTEKYQLLYKSCSSLRNQNDIQLWKTYQSQARNFPGQKFITQDDISRKLNRLVDKKISTKLIMLRNLGILQEQRLQSTVYYLWINKS